MHQKRSLSIIISLLFVVSVCAQNLQMDFEPLNTLNGLPTNEVRRLYQDHEGFLWIATTDGLCSYDGYQLKTYKSNMYSPNQLSNNNVRCVSEDVRHHLLYIGTNSGLNILDKVTGVMKNTGNREFRNNVITSLMITRKGIVFIGSDAGLYRYYPQTNKCEERKCDGMRMQAQHLYEDSKGQVWVGTFNGLFRYNPIKDKFIAYPYINNHASAHIILEDSYHQLWVGSFGFGLSVLENPYQVNHLRIHSFVSSSDSKSIADNMIYALVEDKASHSIWVGTRSGLSVLPLAKGNYGNNFTNYLPGSEPSIPFNEVNALIRDRQGTIWIGTLGGGVYSVNKHQHLFGYNPLTEVKRALRSNSVRSIMVNNDGNIWMGIGSYGLVTRDGKSGAYVHYSEMPAFRKFTSMSTLNTIVRLHDGRILMGSFMSGCYEYDVSRPVADRVRLYNTSNTHWIKNDRVISILEDKYHHCWFGTKTGLGRHDGQGNGFLFSHFIVDGVDLSNTMFQCLYEQAGRYMWAGTSDGGLIRISNYQAGLPKMKFRLYSQNNHKLNNNDIQCIFVDRRNRLWVGTDGGGLNLYDSRNDRFISMNSMLSLPCDGVFSILEDERGHLWMGTNSGLLFMDVNLELSKSSFQLYTVSSGLQNNIFMRGCAFKTPDGEMYFGGHEGYNFFYPSRLHLQKRHFNTNITDIKIFNESWDALPGDVRRKISEKSPSFTDRITLNYTQNNFSIEFSSMNLVNPQQNKYSFMLEGYEKEWQMTDASHRFAYYNNLKPGTYTFRLRVMDENGTWSKNERRVKVIILPPFWMTWWAFIIYFVLAAVIFYSIWYQANIRMRQRNKYHLLKMEKSKVEELNHIKLQFFTNITHELLTPLTIISATVDELKIQVPNQGDLYDILNTNIRRLMRLIQQILEFRKSETSNLKLLVSPGNIVTFVKNEAESFAPLIKKHKLHFSVLCDPDEIFCYYDSDKLDKIIYNLLSNAAKYNREGGYVQLNLTYAQDHDFVLLTVKDNGKGISKERQENLFKRFYEGDYRRFNTIGTGIGLSLTKDLVELHGGTIRVDSEIDKGTTFYVTLPVSKEHFNADQIDEEAVPVKNTISDIVEAENTESTVKATPEAHSVLVIEDNEDLLSVMVKLLDRDYNVLQATNGKEGVDIIENEDVDIIVSDVMMPEMNGIELTKFIKGNMDYSHIPIILLTAKTGEEDRAEAYECGADAYITKPFNLIVLHARIKNLLKKRERTARDFKNQLVFEVKDLDYTDMDEQFMQKAVACVNRHLGDSDFDVPQFIDEMGTSKTTLYKKLKSLAGLNTSSFIRNIRLKAACKAMEDNPAIRVSDLAYEVGFNDPKYFSLCFKKEFGMLPTEYCDRFSSNH